MTDVVRCLIKIKWGTGDHITQCSKPSGHVDSGDLQHNGPGLPEYPYQTITWLAGDRRCFVGEWADCTRKKACILPHDHHGNCAF